VSLVSNLRPGIVRSLQLRITPDKRRFRQRTSNRKAIYSLCIEIPAAAPENRKMSEKAEMKDKPIPWSDNSSFVMTFYSILTAMVGAIMALAIGDQEITKDWYRPIGLLFISLVLFILGIEKYGEAVDEDDIDKYLAWLLAYNIGTVAMFFGIATYVGLHYHLRLTTFPVILVAAFITSWKWWHDTCFLFFKNDEAYEAYRQELLGNRTPEKDRDFLMTLHGFFRKHCRGGRTTPPSPDVNSFTRLRRSKIHGIGVFAIRDIPKDTNIFSDDRSEMAWIKRSEVEGKSGEIRKLYDDFCVIKNDKYGCPKGFNNLTVSWYINEPAGGQKSNVVCSDEYDFVAARDIQAGEELTVDYSTYSEKQYSKV
jgi:hypothetical protein